jgi:hypothetical protein
MTDVSTLRSQDWRRTARQAAFKLARSGERFTADDVTEKAGLPAGRNHVGSVLGHMARQGHIRPVAVTTGTRKAQHGRRLLVWEGA